MNTDLYIKLLEEKVGTQEADLTYLRQEIEEESQSRSRLYREIDDLQRETEVLRASLRDKQEYLNAYWKADAAKAQAEHLRVQEETKRARWAGVDPLTLFPKTKAWTKARKTETIRLIRETIENDRGQYIPMIKLFREQTSVGLKEAKDAVDCITSTQEAA